MPLAGRAFRPRHTARRTRAGTFDSPPGGRSRSSSMARCSSSSVLPSKGRTPWSASCSATQKLNWSDSASALCPANCSGAM
ncbi:hypothetical protein ACN28S_03570 [Cystobacter fuscus]